jgi:hypothetical protein
VKTKPGGSNVISTSLASNQCPNSAGNKMYHPLYAPMILVKIVQANIKKLAINVKISVVFAKSMSFALALITAKNFVESTAPTVRNIFHV